MAVTTGDAPAAGAVETLRAVWQRKTAEILDRCQELIDRALANYRPKGLAAAVFTWDSGASGTPLTADASRPNGWLKVPFPSAAQAWTVTSYPAGSATIVVKAAAPGVALAGATTIATITVAGDVEATSTSAFTAVDLAADTRVAAFLTSATTTEVACATVELRRE